MGPAGARLTIVAACLLAIGGAGVAFAVAAGGAEDDGVLRIGMGDGAIELEREALDPGRQVVEVSNEGSAEHEVVLLRTDLPPGDLPVGLHGVSISQAGEPVIGEDHLKARHNHAPGVVLGLLPGESRRHQVGLEPGRYVVYCQTGSHYLAGERAALTVE